VEQRDAEEKKEWLIETKWPKKKKEVAWGEKTLVIEKEVSVI